MYDKFEFASVILQIHEKHQCYKLFFIWEQIKCYITRNIYIYCWKERRIHKGLMTCIDCSSVILTIWVDTHQDKNNTNIKKKRLIPRYSSVSSYFCSMTSEGSFSDEVKRQCTARQAAKCSHTSGPLLVISHWRYWLQRRMIHIDIKSDSSIRTHHSVLNSIKLLVKAEHASSKFLSTRPCRLFSLSLFLIL